MSFMAFQLLATWVFIKTPHVRHYIKKIILTRLCPVPCIHVSELSQHGSGNGLSPIRRQAITWTNADWLLIGPLGTNFSEIRIEIQNFHSRKCVWKCRLRNVGNFVKGEILSSSMSQRIYTRPCCIHFFIQRLLVHTRDLFTLILQAYFTGIVAFLSQF